MTMFYSVDGKNETVIPDETPVVEHVLIPVIDRSGEQVLVKVGTYKYIRLFELLTGPQAGTRGSHRELANFYKDSGRYLVDDNHASEYHSGQIVEKF